MSAPVRDRDEQRALVLAPRGRDAEVVLRVLQQAGMAAAAAASMAQLLAEVGAGAGLFFITEESLADGGVAALHEWLDGQPAWSDLPVVVLATRQPGRRTAAATAALERLGNVMLLERPLNAETLVSAARAALRSRMRQYQARGQLELQVRIGRDNERLYQAERLASTQAAQMREALALALDAAELGTFHCPVPLGDVVWNDTCKAHFWLPAGAAVDIQLFYDLIHPDDRATTRAAVEAAVQSGQPYDVEYRTVSPRGEQRWLRAKGRAYYDAQGVPTRFDGITIDISRQKQLESERESVFAAEREAREQAEHASRMKDEFLATLSHELRTPLSAMLGWVHVLRRLGGGPPELGKGMDAIERNARLQSRLIDELLDMSRIIAGNVKLELQSLAPSSVVEAVAASLQPAADARRVRIERALDADAAPVVADPMRLQQVVWNLLSNALKFTPEGGAVRLQLRREAEQAVLRVVDDGEGIDPAFLPHVFERFRQGDGSTTRRHGGLGLGLAIVRHLVEMHGGTVAAASDGLGRGATFTVRLPLSREPVGTAAPAPAPPAAPPRRGDELAGLRIVLVDDDADGRDAVLRILAGSGAAVAAAASADEAMQLLQRAAADVLISDIGMPRLDGYGLLRQARLAGHRLPAIALTAFARSEDRAKALAAGYDLHLAKPVEPALLVSSVARLAAARG